MSKLDDKLDQYFDLEDEIRELFGYEEEWRDYPIDDCRGSYYFLTDYQVVALGVPFTKQNVEEGAMSSSSLIVGQGSQKSFWEADGLLLVCADTQTDGNKFLMIFDKQNECKDEALIAQYKEQWG